MDFNQLNTLVDIKINLFEKCINKVGLYKNYPYIDKLDDYLFKNNSFKNKHIDLIKLCTKNELKKKNNK